MVAEVHNCSNKYTYFGYEIISGLLLTLQKIFQILIPVLDLAKQD